ncbi:MAG: hypothetical protein IK127_02025 [Clostridia bacterium]|nr:hypothetical protein [Clostridia bacterium]
MQTPWFLWKGTDSRMQGVVVEQYPPITRAGTRNPRLTIPGRSGSLALGGLPVYADMRLTLKVLLKPGTRPADVNGWLSGSGLLVLGSEPDRSLEARLAAPLQFTVLPDGWYGGYLRFDCHPLKHKYPEESDIAVTPAQVSDSTWTGISNPGDVPARPRYTLQGSGCLTLTWHLPVRDNPPQFTVDLRDTPFANNGGAVFDSESMTVTTLDGSASLSSLSRLENGEVEDFGLPLGITRLSAVSEGGILEGLTVTPRWRWL